MGSVASTFSFKSFKIDKISHQMKPEIQVIDFAAAEGYNWSLRINLRQPQFFEGLNLYVIGVDCILLSHLKTEQNQTEQNTLLRLEVGGVGIFSSDGSQFAPEMEKALVQAQFPALIFAHLRAAITNILASSGFGSIVLPLINIHAIADNMRDKLEVLIVKP